MRSFSDADGDGIGDIEGLRGRLDYLQRLGVEAVWLTPVCRSPQDDNGYDISDYQDIDPLFGTLAGFDALVADLHARGMRLLLDLVVNHTSDEHPWFAESRSSIASPRRGWYWWRPPRAGMAAGSPGAQPNNWGSVFSGPAWELDPATGEHYLHLFSRKQPDLNWETSGVRAAIHAMMRWWLDRGVDGFRMDCINMISKDPALPDGPSESGRPGALGDFGPHVLGGPRLHEFLAEMRRAVLGGRDDILVVGETPGVGVGEARLLTDPARLELDMVFQFEHVQLDQGATKWDARPLRLIDLKASLARWQDGLSGVGWNSLYWSNHDQPRAVSRFGDDGEHRVASAKALAAILHLHRGTPFVYQGEELGMTNAPFRSTGDVRDIEALNHVAAATAAGRDPGAVLADLRRMGRDNARTPMHWDASPNAGFTSGEPWINVNPNHTEINAQAELADPDSVFHWYRRLIELRRTERAVAFGDFRLLLADDERIWAFTRGLDTTELLVVANCRSQPTLAGIPDAAGWASAEVVLGNGAGAPDAGGPWAMGPWEARVLRRTVPFAP